MKLKVISPDAVVFEGDVVSVTLPGTLGSFTVLNNHASIISTLVEGEMSYKTGENVEEQRLHIDGGIADVDNNVVSVCLY